MTRRLFTLTLLVSIFLGGCTFDRQAALVGKWVSTTSGGGGIEFFRDGTVNVTGNLFGIQTSVVGKYKIEENDQMTFEFSGLAGLAGPSLFRYTVSGNQLTLTDQSGNTLTYQRQ